tara:strand:- start:262 stop:438 length:177 start_codon:yes stop_codon:yes gene_type:complete
MVQVELPEDIWIVIRQVIEQTVTAKGRDGSKMLLSIFDAFDDAGITVPEVTEDSQSES